ncbi:hypothetical protein Dimus_016060 [Dionaea muscipula]
MVSEPSCLSKESWRLCFSKSKEGLVSTLLVDSGRRSFSPADGVGEAAISITETAGDSSTPPSLTPAQLEVLIPDVLGHCEDVVHTVGVAQSDDDSATQEGASAVIATDVAPVTQEGASTVLAAEQMGLLIKMLTPC